MTKSLLTIALAVLALAGAGTQASAQAPANVQAVDLGLPSGLYWASCNIGATTPEDYGDYFAWGETAPKADYSQDTYKGTADDVAHKNWGGDWRIPSEDEWKELYEHCTLKCITQNGVEGHKVTSKINGDSVFLPVAGYFYGTTIRMKRGGFYWSSSLLGGTSNVAFCVMNYDHIVGTRPYDCWCGMLVRPVLGEDDSITGTLDVPASAPTTTRKLLRNGQVLILRNGKTYTLQGIEVK